MLSYWTLTNTIEPIMSLVPDLKPISKSSFSCAGDLGFTWQAGSYSSCDGVVLAGIETQVCVYQTDRDLIHGGQYVEVVTDGVTSRDSNNHGIALDRIRNNDGWMCQLSSGLFKRSFWRFLQPGRSDPWTLVCSYLLRWKFGIAYVGQQKVEKIIPNKINFINKFHASILKRKPWKS